MVAVPVFKNLRTADPNKAPPSGSLAPGQISFEMASTPVKMWLGVDPGIDATGRRLVVDSSLYLPLTGGTLTGPGNLTLDGGTLTVSGATPSVMWDRTGVDPAQWELRAQGELWTMHESGELLFRTSRNATVTPTVYFSRFFHQLQVDSYLTVSGGAAITGHLAGNTAGFTNMSVADIAYLHRASVNGHIELGRDLPHFFFTHITPVTGAGTRLTEISVRGVAGIDNTPDVPGLIGPRRAILGAAIRFETTQGWQRDTVVDFGVDPPVITSQVDQLGAQIDFLVSRNGGPAYRAMTLQQDGNLSLPHAAPAAATDVITLGYLTGASTGFLPLTGGTLAGPGNLTLDGGTLTVAGAAPTVIWDKTGADPLRWEAESRFGSVSHWWGIRQGSNLPFYIERNPGPPVSFEVGTVDARLKIGGNAWIEGDTMVRGGLATRGPVVFGSIGGTPELEFHKFSLPITAPNTTLADIWVRGPAGIDNSNAPPRGIGLLIAGAGIRFLSTQGWQRDTTYDLGVDPPEFVNRVDQLGAEIAFFVSRSAGPNTYRAMTLEQDGNLSLPHAVPTAAADVVTLGYLTGASTGFLPLTGGTLTGPGNLAVNGTLAVSNSDTVSATITNTGSGVTGLRITGPGTGNVALEVEGGAHGSALWAKGAVYIDEPGAAFQFTFGLHGQTTSLTTNLINLTGLGGGLYVRSNTSTDPPSVYSIGVLRNMPSNTAAFIQLINGNGFGSVNSAGLGHVLGSIWFGGYDGTDPVNPWHPTTLKSAAIYTEATETWSATGHGSRILFDVTANGTTTAQTALIVENDLNVTVTGTVTASGTLLTSDPALKEISPTPADALAKVCELPVIDFRWKRGRDSKLHRGFSADDVKRVMGEDSGCSAKGAYSLADMNAVLWQAVQELATEVQELRSRIDGTKHN